MIDMWAGVNTALLTTPVTSDTDVSTPAFESHEDILNIYCDTI